MTEQQLRTIQKLVRAAEIDCDCVSTEDIRDVKVAVESALYVYKLKAFHEYVVNSLPCSFDDEDETDAFYDRKFTISFGNQTISIPNNADLYDAMVAMLEKEIEEQL